MAPTGFRRSVPADEAHRRRRHRSPHAVPAQQPSQEVPKSQPHHQRNANTLSAKLTALHRSSLNAAEDDDLYQAYVEMVREKIPPQSGSPPNDRPSSSYWHPAGGCVAVTLLVLCACILLAAAFGQPLAAYVLGIRCFVPNNYLVWEATRPVTDCAYCRNVRRPLILPNMTREEFLPYAYSVQPIILKRAVAHWTAADTLNFTYLRRLYRRNGAAALSAFHDECQFLNFQSNFLTLDRFFAMSAERARTGRPPWYVGFSNCQSTVLRELRRLYPIPHFLPADAEVPNTDYVFMGFDRGAIMHLDYIPRLMWQAQLRGNKSWTVAPTPECAAECEPFGFYVEPGDAVLMDTRIWYHGTSVLNGEFSLIVQSEYG